MTMAHQPTLQDMLKAAMSATINEVDITREAARQQHTHQGTTPQEKTASAAPQDIHYSSEHLEKMASALDYIGENIKAAETTQEPGKGPGALEVLEATSSEANIDAGQSGSAIPKDQPPMSPSTQTEEVQGGKANTGMETNDSMSHPEQPVEPISNEKGKIGPTEGTKQASALEQANVARMRKLAGLPQRSVDVSFLRKVAEDAINPAQISAGAATPPAASASEEGVPSQPSDVNSQTRLISSNQAAIDYTKRDAKADPKKDVNQVLSQPALTRSGDQVLHKTLDNTESAGVKISSAREGAIKIAAARALISNMLEKAAEEKKKNKEKDSMMGGAPNTPSSASGFNASSLG